MKPILLIITSCLLLCAGCASSVVSAGPDTYYISVGPLAIWQSAAKAKAECYNKANNFCNKRKLVMVPIASSAQEPVVGRPGSAELTFRALKPGDPEIKRTNIEAPGKTERIELR